MLTPTTSRFTILAIALWGSLTAFVPAVVAQEAVEAPAAIPAERRPYDVRVLVGFDPQSFLASNSASILHDFDQTVQRCVGDLWSVKSSEITWLSPVSARGLDRLDRSTFTQRFPNEAADVWFVVAIESRPAGAQVRVRSWQPEGQVETAVVSGEVLDRREIPIVLLRLCRDLMRPMGEVEQVNEKSVQIRLRAGELVPPDPSFTQLAQGDLLLPLLVYRDKHKSVERIQTIPWSFVAVDEVQGSTVAGTVQSGLKRALGGKKRGRIDTLVVALRPQKSSTQLELVTQAKTPLTLVAHRIEVRTEPVIPRPTKEHPDVDSGSTLLRELLTDRRGMSKITVEPGRTLVWLFAYSGDHQLARVPFVPGLETKIRLEVPDDATRLAAEADLQMLQGEVIDAVALRNTAFATMRAAAKKDDWITVNQKLSLLKKQQDAGTFIDRLNAVRVAGTAAAKARRDRTAEVRINRICDDTATLIKAHLGDDQVRLLTEEMEALQNADIAKEKL